MLKTAEKLLPFLVGRLFQLGSETIAPQSAIEFQCVVERIDSQLKKESAVSRKV